MTELQPIAKWANRPYEEFVSGDASYIKCRMQYADTMGFKSEEYNHVGGIRIYEDQGSFQTRISGQKVEPIVPKEKEQS